MFRNDRRCIICGLVGIVNREKTKSNSDKLIKFFREALYADALRGVHGTGILGVESNGDQAMYKKSLGAADFIDLTKSKVIMNDTNTFLLGHNRYATQGSHTCENAHPFKHNSVTLFHNGTLNTWKWMAKDRNFTVDSECLAYYISKSTDIKKSLEEIDGAYSLVWYDSLNQTLNFARNKDRPMFFGLIKDSNSFVYASESGMINWLANRNGIELSKIVSTELGQLITISLDDKIENKTTAFTPKEDTKWVTDYGYYGNSYYRNTTKKNVNSDLLGKKILIKANSWESYNSVYSQHRFGKIKGLYEGKTDITVSSILEKDSIDLIGKTLIVTVSSCTNENTLFCTFISVATEKDISDIEDEAFEAIQLELLAEQKVSDLALKKNAYSTKKWKGQYGKLLSESDYISKTRDGCVGCHSEIGLEDHEDIVWDTNGDVICPDCAIIYKDYLPY